MSYGQDGVRLVVDQFGDLDRLQLELCPVRPPASDEVTVRVHAAGLNFRDVLTSMGMLSTDDGARYRIGFECTGVVTAVGTDVTTLRLGDTVVTMDLHGCAFGTFVTVPPRKRERSRSSSTRWRSRACRSRSSRRGTR
ncbi:MAG: alcohol dehydrogenase catalytic domain-containing protein [Mycobacterium sp.]|nr:alcohol dehydrogenase catalytic domain-containing protein [Mycobacterium sp.]